MQRAGPRPCTCLLASPLTPQHLVGSPQGWAGHSHSDRCFWNLCPTSWLWEPPPSGSVLGDNGPVALCMLSTPAEPGHVHGLARAQRVP